MGGKGHVDGQMCDMGAGMEVCRGVDVDEEMSDRRAMYSVDAGVAARRGVSHVDGETCDKNGGAAGAAASREVYVEGETRDHVAKNPVDAGVAAGGGETYVDGQTSDMKAGMACDMDDGVSHVDGQTSDLNAGVHGVAARSRVSHVDGETSDMNAGAAACRGMYVDGETRDRAARYPVDAGVAAGVENVDGQTCDQSAEVSKTVEGGMLNIQEGGKRRRKSENFEQLLRKFDKDRQGGGRKYC